MRKIPFALASLLLAPLLVTTPAGGLADAPGVCPPGAFGEGDRCVFLLTADVFPGLTPAEHAFLAEGGRLAVPLTGGIPVDGVSGRIQPGGLMFAPSVCTFNFVFHHRLTNRLAVGTAGHCVKSFGETVSILVAEPHEEALLRAAANASSYTAVEPKNADRTVSNYAHKAGVLADDAAALAASRTTTEAASAAGRLVQDALAPPGDPLGLARDAGEVSVTLRVEAIGKVIFRVASTSTSVRDGNDFALVLIDPEDEWRVNRTMVAVGGPCSRDPFGDILSNVPDPSETGAEAYGRAGQYSAGAAPGVATRSALLGLVAAQAIVGGTAGNVSDEVAELREFIDGKGAWSPGGDLTAIDTAFKNQLEAHELLLGRRPVIHIGHGTGAGTPRVGYGKYPYDLATNSLDVVRWYGWASGGDSGSPVRIWDYRAWSAQAGVTVPSILPAADAVGILTLLVVPLPSLPTLNNDAPYLTGPSMRKVLSLVAPEWQFEKAPCEQMRDFSVPIRTGCDEYFSWYASANAPSSGWKIAPGGCAILR